MERRDRRRCPSGCSADAVTTASSRIPGTYSYVELRWSPTCRTNWTRVSTGYNATISAFQCGTGYRRVGDVARDADYRWTRMICSPKLGVSARYEGPPGSTATARA